MKYIFMVGAPGSKWSSVHRNIYYSPDLDQSDFSPNRVYSHMATGSLTPMHIGSYFDPCMEFGGDVDKIDLMTREECELMFDEPFSGSGVRIIRSHVLSNHIGVLKRLFPECPIVLVYRDSISCLDWWNKCGGFSIKYPNYQYFKDMSTMESHIKLQNLNILKAWETHPDWDWLDLGVPRTINTNTDLCLSLGIQFPPSEFFQDYLTSDIKIKVI